MMNPPNKSVLNTSNRAEAGCDFDSSAPAMQRRNFLKIGSLATGGLAFSGLPVMAGPFGDVNDYLEAIPQDKKLDTKWVRSLFERGQKDTYTSPAALAHIGMPVGGLFAGTVYLGGDGRLWLWDVFNRDQEGIEPRKVERTFTFKGKVSPLGARSGLNYVDPAVPNRPFAQGFSLRVGDKERALDRTGFSKITFDGRYPIGKVAYEDAACPVQVELTAFSPFIPLNLDDSSLPTTVMSFTVRNTSGEPVEAVLEGHLENPVCLESKKKISGRRINRVVREKMFSAIECIAQAAAGGQGKLERQTDFGSMALSLLGSGKDDVASAQRDGMKPVAEGGLDESLIGRLERKLTLKPGEQTTVVFAFTWHFPNFLCRSEPGSSKREWTGHSYAARFDSALVVANYLADNYERLAGVTRTWVDTWYDSTLPYWLLDRTMANTSTLATTTCYRLKNGRFWAWEGIGCCPGTCTHVWHYAQAPGRLFPEVERITRERVDFGMALHPDGGIGMRAGLTKSNGPADDGQCGRILGALREHQMSADVAFLQRIWPQVRKAIEFLIRRDGNADGILEGAQHNTLDAAWYGKISFISSLYLAALRAGQQMATEVGDTAFAEQCQTIADIGSKNFQQLFNGEYFIQIEDPAHRDVIGTGNGCYIDQIFGQTWAHWVGLGNLFDRDQQLSALRALWKYSFVPDVGPFREKFTQGRWYATAGDAGLLMCTWPKGGNDPKHKKQWQYMYFNECMSGFEHQAAADMVWEGHDQPDILQNGLAIERAIHDRYNAALRNPYNEVECSDHYSRAMASYGVFQAVCGFEYNGPKGHIGFAPRLTPEDFRCAFTSAEGWGSYSQKSEAGNLRAEVKVKWGLLRLRSLSLQLAAGQITPKCRVMLGSSQLPAKLVMVGRRAEIRFELEALLKADQSLIVSIA